VNAAFAKLSSLGRGANWALLPAALIVVAAIAEVVSVARAGGDIPSDADWRSANEYLVSQMAADDLLMAAPRWLDPKLRQFSGKQIPINAAARMDRERFADIWVTSARGARAPETSDLKTISSKRFGELLVTRYAHQAQRAVVDFVERFPAAEASGRWRGRPSVVLDEIGFRPRKCVRGEPVAGAQPAVIYRDVELGRSIVGFVGLADVFTRRDIRSPVEFSVTLNGDEVANVSVGVDDGWVRFEVATDGVERGTIGFHPRAVDAKRLVCFAAEARQ
jgi:hypothetical protein